MDYGDTIYHAALKLGIDIGGVCGGLGICGKCRIKVVRGSLSNPTESEIKILSKENIDRGYRLACQARVLGDVEVRIITKRRLLAAILGYEPSIELNPAVRIIPVKRKIVTLTSKHASSLESIEAALKFKLKIDLDILNKLGEELPENVYLVIYNINGAYEIIDILKDKIKPYGLALDIGTTKIAIYIVDLETGRILTADSFENPQVVFGDDIISRITHANMYGVDRLHNALINELNRRIQSICRIRGINVKHIIDIVVVGNSVMHHLFLGLNPRKMGVAPYELIVREPLLINASKLKLKVNPRAKIYLPPLVRGFIGSDSLMGILLLGLAEKDGTFMFMDVGTNTEVYLIRNGVIYATSTASGPAFEGGHIKFGVKALDGAIDHITINPKTLTAKFETIGNIPPIGICGSGLIDIVAEMLKAKIIDYTGKFIIKSHRRIKYIDGEGYAYIVAYSNETSIGEDIVVTQRDIREVQKAKAAIQAAFKILSRKLGITRNDIDKIYIAGSFGFYMNPKNAIILGLLPEVDERRIEIVGNTAGSGARVLLKNIEWREKARKLVDRINYVELASEEDFNKVYINALYFPSSFIEDYPKTVKILGIDIPKAII